MDPTHLPSKIIIKSTVRKGVREDTAALHSRGDEKSAVASRPKSGGASLFSVETQILSSDDRIFRAVAGARVCAKIALSDRTLTAKFCCLTAKTISE